MRGGGGYRVTAKRVLIVDDDPLTRRLVRDVLTTSGYEVSEGVDGPDGLQKVTTQPPHVILLDLLMPGIDGYEVCRSLKRNPKTREIPVIILTASEDLRLNRLAYAAGAFACITKPFRRVPLVGLIGAALGQRGSLGSGREG